MSDTSFYHQGNQRRKTALNTNTTQSQKIVHPASNLVRNDLYDSEPMSEYTEVPFSYTMMLPAPFQPVQARPNLVQSSPGPMVMRTQRVDNHEMRSMTPYGPPARFQLPAGTPQLLLPSPSPRCLAASYNTEQTFVMHSTNTPAARGPSTAEESRVIPAIDTSPAKSIKNSGKGLSKGAVKLSSVKRRRFFVGTTDQLVRWHKMAKQVDFYAIYEVSAILESISCSPSGAYRMILRNDQKNCALPLQAIFFPIDKNLPKVKARDLVTCIGRMVGTNKLHVYDLWPTMSENLAGLKRISFLCQRTLQEASLATPEP